MVGNDVYWSSAECLGPVKTANGMVFFRRLSQYIPARLVESYGGMLSL